MRCAWRIGILGGVESIAAPPARLASGRRLGLLLNDRRRRRNLRLLIARLGLPVCRLGLLRRAIGRTGRHRRGVRRSSRPSRSGLHAGLKLPQALFELAVAILQLFVLAGQLPQLILEPLDAHFRIDIIGLRETRGT